MFLVERFIVSFIDSFGEKVYPHSSNGDGTPYSYVKDIKDSTHFHTYYDAFRHAVNWYKDNTIRALWADRFELHKVKVYPNEVSLYCQCLSENFGVEDLPFNWEDVRDDLISRGLVVKNEDDGLIIKEETIDTIEFDQEVKTAFENITNKMKEIRVDGSFFGAPTFLIKCKDDVDFVAEHYDYRIRWNYYNECGDEDDEVLYKDGVMDDEGVEFNFPCLVSFPDKGPHMFYTIDDVKSKIETGKKLLEELESAIR